MKPILNPNYELYRKDDLAFCDSLQIAETFERQHSHVLRTIQSLTESTSGLSEEFIDTNFMKTKYTDTSGKRNTKYLMTKDGFVMVVMEFKTAKARQFKEEYINRFNEMADFIHTLYDIKEDFPEFTEAVKLAHETPKPYHYSNEINMIYSIVLGQSPQAYRKALGITDGAIREYFTTAQLEQVRRLQRIDIGLLVVVPDLKARKEILIARADRLNTCKELRTIA